MLGSDTHYLAFISPKLDVEIEKVDDAGSQQIWINKSKGTATAIVKVFIIEDYGHKVAYIPSMDLTGYGKTEKRAQNMLVEAVGEYFHSLLALTPREIQAELKKYGWEKGSFTKRFENRAYIDKLGILRDLELPTDTKIEKTLISVSV